MNIELCVWVGLLIVAIVVEIATLGLTTIWFVPGTLIALVISVLGGHLAIQIAVFVVLSLILIFFTRPIAVKYINDRKVNTNVDAIVGKVGLVSEVIDNIKGTGAVKIDGLEWTARSSADELVIDVDTKVEVKAVEGVKVIVFAKP